MVGMFWVFGSGFWVLSVFNVEIIVVGDVKWVVIVFVWNFCVCENCNNFSFERGVNIYCVVFFRCWKIRKNVSVLWILCVYVICVILLFVMWFSLWVIIVFNWFLVRFLMVFLFIVISVLLWFFFMVKVLIFLVLY